MLKKNLKFFVSYVLALAIICQTVLTGGLLSSAAIDKEQSVTFTDDFSNVENSSMYWENIKLSGTDIAVQDYVPFSITEGRLSPAYTPKKTVYFGMTTVKDEYWSSSARVNSFSGTLRIDAANGNGAGESDLLTLYYDPSTGERLYLTLGWSKANNFQGKIWWTDSTGTKTQVSSGSWLGFGNSEDTSAAWNDGNPTNKRQTFDFAVTYTYTESDGVNTVKVSTKFVSPVYTSSPAVNISPTNITGIKVGLTDNKYADNIHGFNHISISYNAPKTDEMLAEEFRTRNAEILNKETVTLEDLDAYTNAMSDYESITDGAKLLVADEYRKLREIYSEMQENVRLKFYNAHKAIIDKEIQNIVIADKNALYNALEEVGAMSEFETQAISDYITKLNLLKGRFAELNQRYHGDDFENPLYTEECFESSNASKVYTIDTIEDSNWLTVPKSDAVFTTVKDSSWDYTRNVKSVSFDVYLESISAEIRFYPLYNPTEGLKNGIRIVRRGTSYTKLSATRADSLATLNKVTVDGTYYGLSTWADFKEDFGENPQVYTVNIDYTYSTTVYNSETVNVIMVAYKIYNSEEEVIGSQRGIYPIDYQAEDYTGVKIAFSSGYSTAVHYDNLKVTFDDNDSDAQAKAQEFINKYTVLNKTYKELTKVDSAVIDEAIAEYNSFDALTKSNLANEIGLLENQKKYISHIDTFNSVNVNDINTYIEAYKLLKGENDGFRDYCRTFCDEVYSALRSYSDKNEAENDTINILTVGHSMVAGQGVEAEYSYPNQLQTMLNEEYGSGKFRVKNIGQGGAVVSTFLAEHNINRVEDAHPDIVVILLGANEMIHPEDNAVYKEKYRQLVDIYQSLPSSPSIIMCTDVYMASRDVSKVVADEKVLSEELSLPLVDLNKLTVDTYNSDLAELTDEYIASGSYEDDAAAQAAAETDILAKWFQTDKTHYTQYGYGIMAQGVFAALKNCYTDFNIEYADIKNVVCYDNDFDASMQDDIDTLVSAIAAGTDANECMAMYNALSTVQQMHFKANYNASYIALIDANNKSLAEIEVNAFKEAHSYILNAGSYDLSSLSAYVAASEDYDDLSDTAKRMLGTEKARLDAAYEVIKPLAVESLIANGVSNASDYTDDMLLAANSEINTYDYANRKNAEKVQNEILSALKGKTPEGSPKKSLTKVMCVGDSLTVASRNGSWNGIQPYTALLQDKLGEGYHVYNAGSSGATFFGSINSYSATEYYTYAKTYKPDIVIIMLGTNDFIVRNYLSSNSEETVAQAYIDFINYFRGLESAPQVILATVPNCSRIDASNLRDNYNKAVAMQKRVAQNLGLAVLDMAALTADWPAYDANLETNYELSDKLHYNAIAYQEMADYAYSLIKDITSENVYGYLRNTDFSSVKAKCYEEKYQAILTGTAPTAAEAVDMLKDYSRTDNLTADVVNASLTVFKNAGLTPSNNGGTIRSDTTKQNIAFYGKAPQISQTDADLGGAYVSKIGAVMQTYNYLAASGESELTLESSKSTSGYISFGVGDTVASEFRFTLKGTDVSERWGYGIVSRVFAEYTFDDGTTYILYSNDTDSNNPSYATGDFVKGSCVRAVNDVLKRMAKALKNAESQYGEYKGETVVCGDRTIETYNNVSLADALTATDSEGRLATAQETLYLLMSYKSVINAIS